MSELVKIWLQALYTNELEEVRGAIDNEHMWELGYNGEEPVNPHSMNIAALEEYIEVLNEKLKELNNDL